jgi:signal transduction histidine kinase
MIASKEELIFIVVIIAVTFALLCVFFIIAMLNFVKVKSNENIIKLKAAFDAEENERKRISAELHDNIGLKLSVAKLQFELLNNDHPEIKDTTVSEIIDDAIVDIRQISRTQSSAYVLENGLINELELIRQYINRPGKFEVSYQIEVDIRNFQDDFIIHLYRILQELINNTIKHSKATKLALILKENNEKLFVNYSDNGIGFKPEAGKGSGIKNIATRVNLFNGKIEEQDTENSVFNFSFSFEKKHINKK